MRQTHAHTRYMPQLDSLRAFAVGAVLIHHFSDKAHIGRLNLATLGVWLFFVLSGFLITRLLLQARDDVFHRGCQTHLALRQFYARRFLRIFPLYYFVLAVAALLDLGEVRDTIVWHLTYASNFLFAMQGYFGRVTAHFWSLSVEEQFYILWPAVILFAPERLLPTIIVAVIAIGPAFRLIGYYLGFNGIALYTVTLASLDTLGLGALLAYCSYHVSENPKLIRNLHQASRWLGLPGLILLLLLQTLESYELISPVMKNMWFIEPLPWALLFVWLIHRAASGYHGIVGKILELKPIVYIGKISYGIYVYHLFIVALAPTVLSQEDINFSLLPGWIQFGLLAGVTVGMAAISWHLFESTLNSLKNYFSYAEQDAPEISSRPRVSSLFQGKRLAKLIPYEAGSRVPATRLESRSRAVP